MKTVTKGEHYHVTFLMLIYIKKELLKQISTFTGRIKSN